VEAVRPNSRLSLWANPEASYSREGEKAPTNSGRSSSGSLTGGLDTSASGEARRCPRRSPVSLVNGGKESAQSGRPSTTWLPPRAPEVMRANLDRLAGLPESCRSVRSRAKDQPMTGSVQSGKGREIETELLTSRVAIAQARSRLAALLSTEHGAFRHRRER